MASTSTRTREGVPNGLNEPPAHLVVATPTASGKSLCYNLPVLDAFARASDARALYLFPTKALAAIKKKALRELLADAGLTHGAITYDGDTPGDARRAARERSGVLLTNPDMLHAGILPHHANWARFFGNPALRRHRRAAHLPRCLRQPPRERAPPLCARRALSRQRSHLHLASATIGNPAEHASRASSGRPTCTSSRESGAPTGERG
jgi:DEAD/DEAH box helicase domain-containing protein